VIRLKKLNQAGFDHVLLVVIFIVLFGIAGTFFLLQDHALSNTYVELHIEGYGGQCIDNAIIGGCSPTNKAGIWHTIPGSGSSPIESNAGGCLDDWGGGVGHNAATRVKVQYTTCYGDSNQSWHWGGNGHDELVSASGGCLNALGGSGDQLIVYRCNGGRNEIFRENSVATPSTGGGSNGGGGGTTSILTEAGKFKGIPYAYGGGPHGPGVFPGGCTAAALNTKSRACEVDCSGLVSYVIDSVDHVNLGWSVDGDGMMSGGSGEKYWKSVGIANAQPGDIVTRPDHVEFFVSRGSNGTINTFGAHYTGNPGGDGPVSDVQADYYTQAFQFVN
jgi:hypothetical protein